MSKLENLATFIEVARVGSFSAAARNLQVPRSTVSFRIGSLESALQVRLLRRSTRSVVLTEDGQKLFSNAASAVTTLNLSLDLAAQSGGHLKGVIRISVPSDLPQAPIVDAISSFREDNPDIRFHLRLTNDALDLVQNNIDIAVRIGDDDGPDVVRRKLLEFPCGLFAHKKWVEEHGEPTDIEEISDLLYSSRRMPEVLSKSPRNGNIPEACVDVNSFSMIRGIVLKGGGVGALPVQMAEESCQQGILVRILPHLRLSPLRMHLSFATRADMTTRVRAFADHLQKFF